MGGETQYTDANSLAVGAVTVAGMTRDWHHDDE